MDEYEKEKKSRNEFSNFVVLIRMRCIECAQFEYRCIFHFGSTIVSI